MNYFIIESAIDMYSYREDDDYLNANVYPHFCSECRDRLPETRTINIKIINKKLPLVVGGFGKVNVNFARRDFLVSICPCLTESFWIGHVISKTGAPFEHVSTYVFRKKRLPIRGTNPLEVSTCSRCGGKLFVPFPRSADLYIVTRRALTESVYESNEGSLIVSERALAAVKSEHKHKLKCTFLGIRETSLDGVNDPDLEY
jgi:hypothetical protein